MISTLDNASLDSFTTELIVNGFQRDKVRQEAWMGPLPVDLAEALAAYEIRIEVRPGWPFFHPRVFLPGSSGDHINSEGEVCLWREGDNSRSWLTLEGVYGRLREFCKKVEGGFGPEDWALDAHLSFAQYQHSPLVGFDADSLGWQRLSDAQFGRISVKLINDGFLRLGRGNDSSAASCNWYYREHVKHRPTTLEDVIDVLAVGQRKNLLRALRRATAEGAQHPLKYAVILWREKYGMNVLAFRIEAKDGQATGTALPVAPEDLKSLRLRAGPDADAMACKSAVIFGSGSIGSQVAVLMAEAGIGKLDLYDGDALRPSNVVRHIGSRQEVGLPKVTVTANSILDHARWTQVGAHTQALSSPDDIMSAIGEKDIVLDLTGERSFTDQIGFICLRHQTPLITAALFRGGAVGRVRRQLLNDTPIHERTPESGYLRIPYGEDSIAGYEPGCSAPIHNAPPPTVSAMAAEVVQVALDALSGRLDYPSELVNVYRPLEPAPFDRIGRVSASP